MAFEFDGSRCAATEPRLVVQRLSLSLFSNQGKKHPMQLLIDSRSNASAKQGTQRNGTRTSRGTTALAAGVPRGWHATCAQRRTCFRIPQNARPATYAAAHGLQRFSDGPPDGLPACCSVTQLFHSCRAACCLVWLGLDLFRSARWPLGGQARARGIAHPFAHGYQDYGLKPRCSHGAADEGQRVADGGHPSEQQRPLSVAIQMLPCLGKLPIIGERKPPLPLGTVNLPAEDAIDDRSEGVAHSCRNP